MSMSVIQQAAKHDQQAGVRRQIAKRVAVALSLGLVLLAATASLFLVQGINWQISDVLHTYEVRNQARELTIALSQAESSQRGFVLSSDASYIEPYQRAASAITTRLVTLTALTEDDPAQASRLETLSANVGSKLAEMTQTLELVQDDQIEAARRLISTGISNRLMEDVQRTLETFIGEENQKLHERNQGIDQSRRWLVGAIVLALAGAVILAHALFARAQHEMAALSKTRLALQSENEVLEAHVQERTQAVEEARQHAERERERVETLLQDTNHRIGNSLATVSSLLGLQLLRSKSDEVRDALEAARSRVHAIASAHRRLRLGSDLETASTDEFLDAVLEDLAINVGDSRSIEIVGQIDPITVSARDATTIGILVSELVTNAIKHAFPDGAAGAITVTLKRIEGVPTLTVADSGVGMAGTGDSGLGSVIIKQLANQFGGVPDYGNAEGGGLQVVVPLPGIDGTKRADLSSGTDHAHHRRP